MQRGSFEFVSFFNQFIDCLKMINDWVIFSETSCSLGWFSSRTFSNHFCSIRRNSLYMESSLIGLQFLMSLMSLFSIQLVSFLSVRSDRDFFCYLLYLIYLLQVS